MKATGAPERKNKKPTNDSAKRDTTLLWQSDLELIFYVKQCNPPMDCTQKNQVLELCFPKLSKFAKPVRGLSQKSYLKMTEKIRIDDDSPSWTPFSSSTSKM